MSSVLVGDLLKCTFYSWFNGQMAENVKWYKLDVLVSGPVTLQALSDGIHGDYSANIGILLTNGANWLGTRTLHYQGGVPVEAAVSTAGTGAGSGGTNPLPTQTCGLVSLYGTGLTRRSRGRVYIPFPDVSALADTGGDGPAVTYQTDIGTLCVMFAGNLVLTSGMRVATLVCGNPNPSKLDIPDPFIRIVPRGAWATQKRRGDYGRQNLQAIP